MTSRDTDFDLDQFLPYLLNQAAEAVSQGFQPVYRDRYGMTRTQWRVMANLGRFGAMTASDICAASHVEKTKVSRAVATLEAAGHLARAPSENDGRAEILSLTETGMAVFEDLGRSALSYDADLRARLGPESAEALRGLLRRLRAMELPATAKD
ncbi:MarR family transcriptional regulator [Frigidibacter sp. RF13]|uniref:MarR family winged helix-turn-helix transcriptional regulator n=1 Tax=Frigidibacter sp. RF13 TaxID=2997340 RepID=UPI00226D8744|nr:MarR family transcriptional regulator [Frigidibacter sp. RF13]MCY1126650.1 MarR family transcriptional regulator [Frigidibacter sp. RF13]